jgi:Tfp pilus assembly protein PilN
LRPVNLIPPDQRKGAARVAGADASPIGVYVLFGVLGVALLCVLSLVLTTNSVNSKTEELSKVKVQEQGAKQVADALRPYGQFAQVQQARKLEISSTVASRFDWERALHQLSLAIPDNVWLLNLAGTLSPAIDVEASGGGGDTSNLRQKANAPAFSVTGCTYSQHAVARMMTRMQNLDDVTDVQLAKSERKDDQAQAGAAAPTQAIDSAASQNTQDCVGSSRITKFDLLIVFGAAPTASPDAAGGSAATGVSNPSSAAQAIGTANNAAATAQGASASAGGTASGGTPWRSVTATS